jgi:hypothetical protein
VSSPLDALWLVPGASSPPEWFIAFKRTSQFWFLRLAALGRYKHVSCFGHVPAAGAWVFYDFGVNAASLSVVPDRLSDAPIGAAVEDALVLKFVPPLVVTGFHVKPGFTCATAVAHLTGVRSSALRPDRFLRDCLAAGAEIVLDEEPSPHVLRRVRAQA